MPTLNWLTREQDLKAAANAEYRLLAEDDNVMYRNKEGACLLQRTVK
jgi:hypothetical protein